MLLHNFLLLSGFVLVKAKISEMFVSLSADDVIKTFKSVFASGLVDQLADKFALKAAERFMEEMNHKKIKVYDDHKPNVDIKINRQRVEKQFTYPPETTTSEPHILDEEEALALIQEPSSDGDNLEKESPYLSEEEIGRKDNTVPVVGLLKVNGVYLRRYLGDLELN